MLYHFVVASYTFQSLTAFSRIFWDVAEAAAQLGGISFGVKYRYLSQIHLEMVAQNSDNIY